METEIHVLDIVALLADQPAEGLEGRAYAFATCRADELLVLHQEPEPAR